ncbi:MAG: type II secretion system F family protein [Nanoarchaeota archaeon]|nr:type II secretion system F family protein [Nanoarchaeota archaeon]
MIKIPFSILPVKHLNLISTNFLGVSEFFKPWFPFLENDLKQSEAELSAKEYLSLCISADVLFFIFMTLVLSAIFIPLGKIYMGVIITLILVFFIFLQQLKYPKLKANRKSRDIEKNLLSALRTIYIQLNSGVNLFDIFVSISNSNYGGVSKLFRNVVRKINTGSPQIAVLEELEKDCSSIYFRKVIWQIINGMRSGSNLTKVLDEIINSLSQEQLIQIEEYGSQLNPLAMFYMLIAVIAPALGITFLIVISSFVALDEFLNKVILFGLFVFVLLFQISFLGIIKTKRPVLLGD